MTARLSPFLLSALPPLPDLGEAPPFTGAELRSLVEGTSAGTAVDAVLLGEDLLLWLTARAGAVEAGTAGHVLSAEQVAGEQDLPEHLADAAADEDGRLPEDRLWAAWFERLFEVAAGTGSVFLARWAAWEIGLRNELVRLRAEALDLDADASLVLPQRETAEPGDLALIEDAESAVRHAVDPLAAQEALDRLRLRWLDAADPRYSFDDDELVVYAARLSLVNRWHRISSQREQET